MMPAKFANPFCRPVHFPAAAGPARVCVIAQWLDENKPEAIYPKMSKIIERVRLETMAAGKISIEPTRPDSTIVLRTNVGEAPRAIHRSEIQPPARDAPALAVNG